MNIVVTTRPVSGNFAPSFSSLFLSQPDDNIESIWAERFAKTQTSNSPTVVSATIESPKFGALRCLANNVGPFVEANLTGRGDSGLVNVNSNVPFVAAGLDNGGNVFAAALAEAATTTPTRKSPRTAVKAPQGCYVPPPAADDSAAAPAAHRRKQSKPRREAPKRKAASLASPAFAAVALPSSPPAKKMQSSQAVVPRKTRSGASTTSSKGGKKSQVTNKTTTTTTTTKTNKTRIDAADRRRARNRVNAAVSRQKRENYIQYLERKAQLAVTVQGTKGRMHAVELAWTAVNERGGGGGGGGGDGGGGGGGSSGRSGSAKKAKKK